MPRLEAVVASQAGDSAARHAAIHQGHGSIARPGAQHLGLHLKPLRGAAVAEDPEAQAVADRKSTRLNSSHPSISYAVFCLKKKNRIVKHLRELAAFLRRNKFAPRNRFRVRAAR